MARTFTAQEILNNLDTNGTWVERAVVALWRRQTADEQATHSTNTKNGMGFNGVDAEILTSFAEQIQGIGSYEWNGRTYYRNSPKRLSDKQLAIARKKLPKYVQQLLAVQAEQQAAEDACVAASIRAEQEAEAANERSFEERGWRDDPQEREAWKYDPQVNGDAAAADVLVDAMLSADWRDDPQVNGDAAAATAAHAAQQEIYEIMLDAADKLAERRPAWHDLTDEEEQMIHAYWLRGLSGDEDTFQAIVRLVGHLPAWPQAGAYSAQPPAHSALDADPVLRPVQASTDAPAADGDGDTDEFDAMFPRMAPARATHVGQQTAQQSIEGWAEGVYGNLYTPGRKGWARKTQATGHMSNRALATAVERMRY